MEIMKNKLTALVLLLLVLGCKTETKEIKESTEAEILGFIAPFPKP